MTADPLDVLAGTGGLPARLAPQADRDSAPWWEALGEHRFVLQRCARCEAWRWPARAICGRCGSFDWSWSPASGRGTLASWTVNHHTFDPAFRSPYTVVFVRLEEQADIVMPGALAAGALAAGALAAGSDGAEGAVTVGLHVGLPVDAEIVEVPVDDGSTVALLAWRPRSSGDGVDG